MMDLTLAVPILVAVVEALKRAGLTSKYAPIASILLGLVFFFLFGVDTLVNNIFEGLIAGLTASGLYSGVKATFLR